MKPPRNVPAGTAAMTRSTFVAAEKKNGCRLNVNKLVNVFQLLFSVVHKARRIRVRMLLSPDALFFFSFFSYTRGLTANIVKTVNLRFLNNPLRCRTIAFVQ